MWTFETQSDRRLRIIFDSYNFSGFSSFDLTIGTGNEIAAKQTVIFTDSGPRVRKIIWTESSQIWVTGKLHPQYALITLLLESYYLGKVF